MIGFVTGLTAEARLLHRYSARVRAGGGTPDGARKAAILLAREPGTVALVSFGLAGGLDPALPPGSLVVPECVIDGDGTSFPCDATLSRLFGGPTVPLVLGGGTIAETVERKHALFAATGAAAIDLESAAVARVAEAQGLRFAVLRAVADPATRNLPPVARVALDESGRISPVAIGQSLIRHPFQIGSLIALGREAALARRTIETAFEGYRLRVNATGT